MRDYTYIGGVIEVTINLIEKPALANKNFDSNKTDPPNSRAPHRIFDIGNKKPIYWTDFISSLKKEICIKSKKTYKGFKQRDVKANYASIDSLQEWIGYKLYTSLKKGVRDLVELYKVYYNLT